MALLLDIDPIDLARGKVGSKDGGLFDYVNDRPYASTSFMSTAISRVFGTAMSGRCEGHQELADTPLKLTASIYALRDNGVEELAKELFEPLGYEVQTKRSELDEKFPEWGMAPYIDLVITGNVKVSELLNHLYVLIPVFDKQKHYYISEDEIQKLLRHGEGWLSEHPAKGKITMRYFNTRRSYARKALDRLMEVEDEPENEIENEIEDESENEIENEIENGTKNETGKEIGKETGNEKEDVVEGTIHKSLNTMRLEAVRDAVIASGAASVIDLGCGECKLTSLLLNESQIKKVTACDVSIREIEKAAFKLHLDRMQPYRRNKLTLMQASLTYRDKRFEGYDCACVVEVIEHIEPMRIKAFERSVFEFASPRTVIVTTPNREYNVNYERMKENDLRHGDHRFEWTREEFATWTEHICQVFGYTCRIQGIGDIDEKTGTPTQMGVFTKNG